MKAGLCTHLHHWQKPGAAYFVTWRLAGPLPHGFAPEGFADQRARFAALDKLLDTDPRGPRWMAKPQIAETVADSILEGENRGRYELGHWVVMPNHVHIVLRPTGDLAAVIRQIKSVSAREANKFLNLTGKPFWARDYFDRWIRDRNEEDRIVSYIMRNPTRAGLDDWRWMGVGQTRTSAASAAGPNSVE